MLSVANELDEAYFLADRLAVIDIEEILQVNAPGEILRFPCCPRVAREGVKNILPGIIATRDGADCRVRVGDVMLDAPASSNQAGVCVHVCVHPERIMLLGLE